MRKIALLCLCASLAFASSAAFAADTQDDASSQSIYPQELLDSQPTLKSEYQTLMKPVESDHGWVKSIGTASPVSQVKIDDQEYAVISSCKPHDCASENLVAMMTPSSDKAVGALAVNKGDEGWGPTSSTITWLGKPDRHQRQFMAALLFN